MPKEPPEQAHAIKAPFAGNATAEQISEANADGPEYEKQPYEDVPRFIMEDDIEPTDFLLEEIENPELMSDVDNYSEYTEDEFRILQAPE